MFAYEEIVLMILKKLELSFKAWTLDRPSKTKCVTAKLDAGFVTFGLSENLIR